MEVDRGPREFGHWAHEEGLGPCPRLQESLAFAGVQVLFPTEEACARPYTSHRGVWFGVVVVIVNGLIGTSSGGER